MPIDKLSEEIKNLGYESRKELLTEIARSLKSADLDNSYTASADEFLKIFCKESGLIKIDEDSATSECNINPFKAFEFVSNILKGSSFKESEIYRKKYGEFEKLFNEFLDLSISANLPETVTIYQKLEKIRKIFFKYLNMQDVYGKRLVAVGGGFSAGKSTFINSLVSDYLKDIQELLPTATDKTSTVPTFITGGIEENIVYKVMNKDHQINEINFHEFKAIQYDFEREYHLRIIDMISDALVVLPYFPYDNLAFLDTPGVNTEDRLDDDIALNAVVGNADAVIWIITSADISGDLHVLKKTTEKGLDLLILYNTVRDHNIDHINLAKKNLDDYGIKYQNLVAIDAFDNREFNLDTEQFESERSITEFLEKQNLKNTTMKPVYNDFSEISSIITRYFDRQILTFKKRINEYKDLEIFIKNHSTQNTEIRKKFSQVIKNNKSYFVNGNKDFKEYKKKFLKKINEFENIFESELKYCFFLNHFNDIVFVDEQGYLSNMNLNHGYSESLPKRNLKEYNCTRKTFKYFFEKRHLFLKKIKEKDNKNLCTFRSEYNGKYLAQPLQNKPYFAANSDLPYFFHCEINNGLESYYYYDERKEKKYLNFVEHLVVSHKAEYEQVLSISNDQSDDVVCIFNKNGEYLFADKQGSLSLKEIYNSEKTSKWWYARCTMSDMLLFKKMKYKNKISFKSLTTGRYLNYDKKTLKLSAAFDSPCFFEEIDSGKDSSYYSVMVNGKSYYLNLQSCSLEENLKENFQIICTQPVNIKLANMKSPKVALKCHNGNYLYVNPYGKVKYGVYADICSMTYKNKETQFIISPYGNEFFKLESVLNKKHLRNIGNTYHQIAADKLQHNILFQIKFVNSFNKIVMSLNGKYCAVNSDLKTSPLVADKRLPDSWSILTVEEIV